ETDVLGEESDLREHRSRGWSRRREDPRLVEPELESRPHPRLISRQVAARDQAADSLLALFDLARHDPAVEAVGAATPNVPGGPAEVAVVPKTSGRGSGGAGEKDRSSLGIARQPVSLRGNRAVNDVGHDEAVAGQPDGRLEEHLPWELAGEPVRDLQAR